MISYILIIFSLILNITKLSVANINNDEINNKLLKKINIILNNHKKTLKATFQNSPHIWDNEFDRSFFVNTSFLNDSISKNFFNTIHNKLIKKQNSNGINRYISYSKSIMINGIFKSVHYEYKADGHKATFHRYTNNNGHILKASYIYNVQSKLFEVFESKNSKIQNHNSYKLIV